MPNLSQDADCELWMESPLDVLSRAASMVETRDLHGDGEASLKRQASQRSPSPIAHHPRKLLRQERASSPPSGHTVQDAEADNNRRCTGTQTSFTSFLRDGSPPADMFPSQDSGCRLKKLNNVHYVLQGESQAVPQTVAPQVESENNAPLNLSISGSSPQHRPSVITLTSRPFPSYPTTPVNVAEKENGEFSDPAIEEHFRRSLGHMYGGRPQPKTPEEPTPAALPQGSPKAVAVKVTPSVVNEVKVVTVYSESVDDHFAKSLGDTWKQIKAKETTRPDSSEGSVDDHFAKALGAAWHKIKEGSDSTSCTSSMSRSPSPSSQHFSRSLGDSWNPTLPPYGPSSAKRPRTDSGCSSEHPSPGALVISPFQNSDSRHHYVRPASDCDLSSSNKCSPERT